MAFQFPLAPLLRFRQSLERRQELLLEEANQQAAEVRRSIDAADEALANLAQREARELEAGLRAAELQFDLLCRSVLLGRRSQLKRSLAQAEELCSQRRHAYDQARRQREVVDTLRREQQKVYQQHEARREQRRVDDLFLLRREFLRRS